MSAFEEILSELGFTDATVSDYRQGMLVVRANTLNGQTYQKFASDDVDGLRNWLQQRVPA